MVLLPAGKALIWHKLDELFIVYQPSSTETHLFNEISALILARVRGPGRTALRADPRRRRDVFHQRFQLSWTQSSL